MKILCVGQNYPKHIKELDSAKPEEPVIFLKPDTALLKKNRTFYLPSFSENIHYEVEIVVKISKIGKNIAHEFAYKYYKEIGLGIDFTARDLQTDLKGKGLPWEKAKAFDFSAPISDFLPKKNLPAMDNISFSLVKNDKIVQAGNTRDMLFPIDTLISYISGFFTLKIGDLIFTGTPEGVNSVQPGDSLVGKIGKKTLLNFQVK